MSAIAVGYPSTARHQGQSGQAIVARRPMRSRGDLDRETSGAEEVFENESGQARVGLAGRAGGRAGGGTIVDRACDRSDGDRVVDGVGALRGPGLVEGR